MFYKICSGIIVTMLIVLFFDYYEKYHPNINIRHLTCDNDKQFIMDNLQKWIIDGVSEQQLKKYKLKVVDIYGFREYATNQSELYDDFKGDVVCKASLKVDFSLVDGKTNTQTTNENIKTINVGYQLVPSTDGYVYISMSGIDAKNMQDDVDNFMD